MSGLLPAAVFGLQVPCGDLMVPAIADFPASFRITMAAIDPTAAPEFDGNPSGDVPVRATLKLVREPVNSESDESSEDGDDYLKTIMDGTESDDDEEEDESSDDEKNGGPSDPTKSKKARREAALEQLKEALEQEDSDEDMGVNGGKKSKSAVVKTNKGKGKLVNGDAMNEDSSDEEEDFEEFVICTLDPEKHYQQPLDITVGEHEQVYFKVSGTHAIYLTGNYVIPIDDRHNDEDYDSDEDEGYELEPNLDEVYNDGESDELDDIEDPRITELGSEDEASVPKLVKAEPESKKGKNKRPAEDSDEPANLDDIMAKALKPEVPATNGEPKLSKKQLKKLKNNAGKPVDASAPATNGVTAETKDVKAEAAEAKDKKVKFAKNLEQGPSGTTTAASTAESEKKADIKKDTEKLKATLGVKTVQGVKIDDKKLGSGPAAKKGDKVTMRYIGKLEDGKVFDGKSLLIPHFLHISYSGPDPQLANKKGKPFGFKLGSGEVIKGWDIGINGMSIGGERRITIPAHLAYGSKSMPGIPANSQLIFEVKLLEIK